MIETMIQAAKAAGDILEKYYGQQFDIEHKGEKGFVSHVDKQAENIILSILLKKYDYNIIAEESGIVENESEYCWVIDPLDGTSNFIRQIPFFCVSIALLKNNQLEAAVIYTPIYQELFYAKKNEGAFLNGKLITHTESGMPTIINCNYGYGKEAGQKYLEALENIFPNYLTTRHFGSSALELAYLAAGRVDCFITYGDELYDIAAGILIAKEAGCIASNWDGYPWKPEEKDLLVAPKLLHRELLSYLTKVGKLPNLE